MCDGDLPAYTLQLVFCQGLSHNSAAGEELRANGYQGSHSKYGLATGGSNGGLKMIWLALIFFVVLFGQPFYAEWRNPSSKGRSRYRPKTILQEIGEKFVQPKQGSSVEETGESGLVYLVSHSKFNSVKIGISSNSAKGNRLQDHTQYGWKVESLWSFDRLRNAEQVEGAVIAWWRNVLSLPSSCRPGQMPQGGYTETVSLESLSLNQIVQYADELARRADGQKAIRVPIAEAIPGASMRIEGQLKYICTGVRTAKFSGSYGSGRKSHEWHRWVIADDTGEMLVELRKRDAIPIRELKVDSKIEVTGRVEQVGAVLRMTNPVYRVIAVGKLGRIPRQQLTNEGRQTSNPWLKKHHGPKQSPNRRATLASDQKENSKVHPRIFLVNTFEKELTRKVATSSLHAAERCSSCEAWVANGAAHDCR